jgi:serine phosphatase RsbU (regulator of sigma subunit)
MREEMMKNDEIKQLRQRIAELEAVEAKYKETEASLEFERKRLYAVLEAIPVWVYLQAPDYSIRWGNSKFLQLFGDPKGRPCYKALQNRDSPCVPCPTFRVFETKTLQKWEYSGGGHTSIIYDNYFLDSDGSPLVLEMGIDITDLKEKEQEIRELNEALEHRVAERTAELAEANAKLSEAVKALWGEMELAKKIQTVLLPQKPKLEGYEIAASMQPSEEVGGDYYDVISVGGFDWIVIGDVSGHGVTAGLVMMMVQTSIHTVLIQNPEAPTSQLLSVVNQAVYENLVKMDESKHMTIVVLACGKNGFFNFSGLHDDMLLWCADTRKVEIIKTDGMWIGLEPDISEMLTVDEFKMEKGDCLVLYSDGIIEAWGKDGKMFGRERLTEVVEKFGDKSVSEIHDAILNALHDYEKSDDVTLLVMKRV